MLWGRGISRGYRGCSEACAVRTQQCEPAVGSAPAVEVVRAPRLVCRVCLYTHTSVIERRFVLVCARGALCESGVCGVHDVHHNGI